MQNRNQHEEEQGDKNGCTACGATPYTADAADILWCPEHQFRGDFVNWGAAHGWRELHCGAFAVAPGKPMYMLVAAIGNEEMVWHLRSYQEMLRADDTRDLQVA